VHNLVSKLLHTHTLVTLSCILSCIGTTLYLSSFVCEKVQTQHRRARVVGLDLMCEVMLRGCGHVVIIQGSYNGWAMYFS
jgi:hypothetical protein